MKQRTGLADTDPEMERVMIELARTTPDWKKIEQVCAMIETTHALAMAGLRERYPNASEEELKKRFAALVLDRQTVIEMYSWDPEVEGY